MKIQAVRANNRRRVFELDTRRGEIVFPYAECDPAPSSDNRVVEVIADPELGKEAFTYTLESGAEGSVHVDSVLEYNEDPNHMADLTLYRLTTEARQRFEDSPLSAREVARRLGTSPAQLYRLMDPTNYTKSLRQMLSLLYVLGFEVEMDVRARSRRGRRKAAACSATHVATSPSDALQPPPAPRSDKDRGTTP